MKRENPAHTVIRRYEDERRQKQRRKGRNHSCYRDKKEVARRINQGVSRRLPQPAPTMDNPLRTRRWKRGDPIEQHYST